MQQVWAQGQLLYPSVVLHRLAAAMFAGELNFIVPGGGLNRSYSHGHETLGADEMPHECRRFRLAGLGHCNLLHQEGLPECINRLRARKFRGAEPRWDAQSRIRLTTIAAPATPSASGSDFCPLVKRTPVVFASFLPPAWP